MIRFGRSEYDRIIKHAYRGEEAEICGILGGTHEAEQSIVTSVRQAENVAEMPQMRYYIDPEEQLELTEELEANGEEVVGFYHSHPAGPTKPSETDAARATWPGRSYVIVAMDGYPFVGSWRWQNEDGFEQEIVAIE